jgi:hypothetical protein
MIKNIIRVICLLLMSPVLVPLFIVLEIIAILFGVVVGGMAFLIIVIVVPLLVFIFTGDTEFVDMKDEMKTGLDLIIDPILCIPRNIISPLIQTFREPMNLKKKLGIENEEIRFN